MSDGNRKHGDSLMEAAQIMASQAHEESMLARMNTLCDTKRNLVIRLASEDDRRVKNSILCESLRKISNHWLIILRLVMGLQGKATVADILIIT